ncbi:hypothetical protein [Xanthomonas oryzae]|nr:hypothetical protein [Xanthomonas oryzae]MDI9069643.1 hypothetical protein [Xanthomonas oryzae pv. oryzae]MDI9080060.1 hypothetical protein [Xanthomonas oryzae pv. oryzae]MDI9103498.1 hypothetical protein [Xanthomonas oryzae pv. oryzae]MDI9912229.1 hypothetical protein [Xanthomonas oryzae pv. oryzae]WEL03598.1 hypothetical protein NO458_10010 [Xanthomonas oryzae pv. oryzae]
MRTRRPAAEQLPADELFRSRLENQILRFPHISSCEIKHLLHQGVEEGARMGHASR